MIDFLHSEDVALPSHVQELRLLSLACGTGIAGAFVEHGVIADHLFEPGKACLNLEPNGSAKFPDGLAANNQVARGILEGLARKLLQLPKASSGEEFPVDLRKLGELARSDSAAPLPAWLPPDVPFSRDELIRRAGEPFRVLGRAIGDLVMTLNLHLAANAVSVAGGPLQGLPDEIAQEIALRCHDHGFELDPGTSTVRMLKRGTTASPLDQAIQHVLKNGGPHWTHQLLQATLDEVRDLMRLSDYDEVGEFFQGKWGTSRYLPVSAFATVMRLAAQQFPAARQVAITYDSRKTAILVLPDDVAVPDRFEALLAKFTAALWVNQSVTRGFCDSNFSMPSVVAETLAPFHLDSSIVAKFVETPATTGLQIIAKSYYETWRRACDLVSAKQQIQADNSAEPPGLAICAPVRVGVDIGGTEVKIAVLKWTGNTWELCTRQHECLVTETTDSVIGPKPDKVKGIPPVELEEAADRILDAVNRAIEVLSPGGMPVHLGLVFPAAIARHVAIGGTSATVARFAGQTPIIVDSTAEQLVALDIRGVLIQRWQERHRSTPQVVLMNDGTAFAKGALLASEDRPLGISALRNRQGALGAIGAAANG